MKASRLSKDFALDVVRRALRHGASAAEVMVGEGSEFEVAVRLGQVENVKQSSSAALGIRVFVGSQQAAVATSDLDERSMEKLIEDVVELARWTSADEAAGLPEPDELASDLPDLSIYDAEIERLSTERKIDLALAAEAAALAFDPRLVNSDRSGLGTVAGRMILANSLGFVGEYQSTSCSLGISPVARENGQMQRGYWFDAKRTWADLEAVEAIGRRAAERTIRKLGARKGPTGKFPIVFDPLVASEFLGDLVEAVAGTSIYHRASFLADQLGTQIAPEWLTVVDDGRMPKGMGSQPFDDEGAPTRRTIVIENGVLRNYLLNTYTARKLNLKTTGNASRALAGLPFESPTNLFIEPGPFSPQEIIGSVRSGLYVTETIGFGVNIVNGDYSRGASGLWIENGQLAYPVEEVTIAGNLKDMLRGIEMIGGDLEFRGSVAAPTLKISSMTISGE